MRPAARFSRFSLAACTALTLLAFAPIAAHATASAPAAAPAPAPAATPAPAAPAPSAAPGKITIEEQVLLKAYISYVQLGVYDKICLAGKLGQMSLEKPEAANYYGNSRMIKERLRTVWKARNPDSAANVEEFIVSTKRNAEERAKHEMRMGCDSPLGRQTAPAEAYFTKNTPAQISQRIDETTTKAGGVVTSSAQ